MVTFSNRILQVDGDQPIKLVNWLADDQGNSLWIVYLLLVIVAEDGLGFTNHGYHQFGSTRASVGVSKGWTSITEAYCFQACGTMRWL